MDEKLRSKLELFAENAKHVKKDFFWQSTQIRRLAALLYAAENKAVDCVLIQESHELIKRSTGLFSTFRGSMSICIAAMLSLSTERAKRLSSTLDVYKMMKAEKFKASDYLVLAAFQIAANADAEKYMLTVERAKSFYDSMKENHWFYTGRDDYIFAAMLGLSDIDLKTGTARMERLQSELKGEFISGNSIQTLTQVLVLGGETTETVNRVIELRDGFKERRMRLDREYTLCSLGVLSLLPGEVSSIIDSVLSAYDFLRKKEGFGSWSVTKNELLLFSASIAAFTEVEEARSGILPAALSTSIANIVLAQQAATAAMVTSSAAATASLSS